MLLPSLLAAQQNTYTLTGRARDADSGAPLSSVQITIRGARQGGLTDRNGNFGFTAQLAPGRYVVEAQMIGRQTETREITLGADGTVAVPEFALRTAAINLGEIVVTGTAGPTARRALGNAVSTVSGERLTETPATTIDQALQGKVAGAVITSNTGTPGGGVSIRLRGTSSIVGGAEPLYIVDGVIIDNNGEQQVNFGYRSNPSNRLADLDPNDIDRIEILKGAAAAALYGSRANNGVVQIFTKRGSAGAPRITASYQLTRSDLERDIEFALTPKDINGNTVARFDHQKLLFREPLSYDASVSVAGGSQDTRYYVSGNFVDQQGIMKGSDHQKLNFRMNLDQRLGELFDIGFGANYIRSHSNLVINGEQGTGGLLTAIVFAPTTLNLAARDPVTGELVNRTAGTFPNPLNVLENWETPQDLNRFVGSLQARFTPLQDVRLEYRLGFDRYEMETSQFIPRGDPATALGSAQSYNRRNMLVNNDLVGSMEYGLGGLRLSTSAGMNHTYQRVDQFNLTATDLVPLTRLVRGAVQTASEGQTELVTLGFFGQQQFNWQDRLYLTGALRTDASSTFGADERWQLYPKVSGSWVVSEEPFWEGLSWWPELRLRAALGWAGNQPPLDAAYARSTRYTSIININRLGLVPQTRTGNPDLKPERQREWEAGFDAAFFNQRLGARFTYYDQFTDDLLLVRPFTLSAGYGEILDNVGAMSNKGIELELNTSNINTDKFGWTSRIIYSRNRNKIERLDVAPYFVGYTNRVEEGQPVGMHYMAAFARDGNGQIIYDSAGGRWPKLYQENGVTVRRIVGDPWPDWTGSLMNEFRFGSGLTASVLLDGSFGAELWNQTQRIMNLSTIGAGPLYDKVLRGEMTVPELNRINSIWEYYLEDATYVKLRDVAIRYSTSAPWLQRIGASQMQLELTGRNLYTWTDYSGYDPEINMFGLSTVERGTDFAVYPNPRTIGFGVRLTY